MDQQRSRQRLVVDEAAGPGEAAHLALLAAIGQECEFEGLEPLHRRNIVGSVDAGNDIHSQRIGFFPSQPMGLPAVAKAARIVMAHALTSYRTPAASALSFPALKGKV